MDYQSISEKNGNVYLHKTRHFTLQETLDNGQAFRWDKNGDIYTGIALNRSIAVSEENGTVTLYQCTAEEFHDKWHDYFNFDKDYAEIRAYLKAHGESIILNKAMDYAPGLRLLKQDLFEVLISFIFSQNNNIPRIKGMIMRLCEQFGKPLSCGRYTFPAAQELASLNADDLALVKAGYRTVYVIDAAQKIAGGKIDLEALRSKETDEILRTIQSIKGIGPKVADCVALFGYHRAEISPMDVWMKRVMHAVYPQGYPDAIKEYAGIAQQYLFHYARNGNALEII